MLGLGVYRKYQDWVYTHEDRINTYANHLIVIFAFSVPTLISVRRVSITLIILLFLARGRIVHHMVTVMRNPLVASFAIYFLVHALWLIGADETLIAKRGVHDASFLLFVPLFVSFLDKRYVKRVVAAFVLGMLVSAIFSYAIFFGMPPSILHNGTSGIASNPTPLYHHVHYGYMLAIVSAMVLSEFIRVKDSGFKAVIYFAFFIFLSVNVFIIAARTGYVLYCILVLMVILYNFRYKILKPLVVVFVLLPIALTVIYSSVDVFKKRVDMTISSSESLFSEKNYNTSIGARAGMLVYSVEVILDNLAFGNGTGDHVSEVRKRIKAEKVGKTELMMTLDHTHNEYTSALLQFGVLGFLAFLNIPFQMLRYSSKENGLMLKIIAVSILVYSLSDVFIIGLGMLLTVVTLSSVVLSRYYVTNVAYEKINVRLFFNYVFLIVAFYAIKITFPQI